MIDPDNVTNFYRNQHELEEFFLFTLVVAGKTATIQARLLEGFICSLPPGPGPFARIALARDAGTLFELIKASRLGQFNRLHECFVGGLSLDLQACTTDDMEAIRGIGSKTSRFFVMHSRANQRVAALDTHILKHLRAHGHPTPLTTPASKAVYRRLEEIFIDMAQNENMSVADYDLMIWKRYSHAN